MNGEKLTAEFKANTGAYIKIFVESEAPRFVAIVAYNKLVFDRKVMAIEKLPEGAKEALKNECRGFLQGTKTSRIIAIDFCKALMVINYFSKCTQ